MWTPLLLVVVAVLHFVSGDLDWNYDDVDAWQDNAEYEICGVGLHQSPIRLSSLGAIYDRHFTEDPLRFANYGRRVPGVFSNDGRIVRFTVQRSMARDLRPRIWAGGYYSTNGYILEAIEFHWGNSSQSKGSEHVIDGQSAPMEVHFVHYNGRYLSYEDALNFSDGLAIVAFLFEATNESNLVIEDYIQVALEITKIARQSQTISSILDFSTLIPRWAYRGDGIFFRYNGSMTYPPCSEIVSWTVYQKRIFILQSTLDFYFQNVATELWTLDNRALQPLANNYRSTQAVNGRQVRTNLPYVGRDLSRTFLRQAADGTQPFNCFGTLLCMPLPPAK